MGESEKKMANRIETRMAELQKKNEKAFIVYMTAGLPDMEGCANLIKAHEQAGTDVLEIGVPFSDPVADGPVIQAASYKSICQGTNVKNCLELIEGIRKDGCEIPVVFMMYYNTILYYGLEKFAAKCAEVGVDGIIVPDLPYEEQDALQAALQATNGSTILLQLISPVSKDRIPMILENARGFVYCVSSMGVTGQQADFHKNVINYLESVKKLSKVPVMMGFGIRTAKDVQPMRDIIDGCIVGTHFINLMEESGYDVNVAKEYVTEFKRSM